MTDSADKTAAEIGVELRKWWRFDSRQTHTHSWHDREYFIDHVLPYLIRKHCLTPVVEALVDLERMPMQNDWNVRVTEGIAMAIDVIAARLDLKEEFERRLSE